MQIDGKSYVEVEALARLVEGSVSFQGNQITLTLPASTPGTANQTKDQKGFSRAFLDAGIEEMTAIREWRVAIVNAIQTRYAMSAEWVGPYRRAAESRHALTAAATVSDSDRSALTLLANELAKMQKWSDSYVAKGRDLAYIPADALDNDPLNQQILSCARGLAALAAAGQFQDVPSCH
jgi:hypothetical protein